MPFVRRDESGKITGWASTEQPDTNEFLPDDHPEVVAFNARFPPGFLKQPTAEEIAAMDAERIRLDKEHEEIRKFNVAFALRFSELELALGNLLYEIIHRPESRLAHAIYYSPTSFHARCEIVSNSVTQIADENKKELEKLNDHWETIDEQLGKCRTVRNLVAHASQITSTYLGKRYARLAPPAFDIIRIDRQLAKRKIPGLGADDLLRACYRVAWVVNRVDEVNRLIVAFHSDRPALPGRFLELDAGMKASRSPPPTDPTT